MSIIGRAIMAGESGGGGLAATDAVLIVRAPTGSSVTASTDGTTLTGDERVLTGRPYVADYVIPVPQRLFGVGSWWTITASRDGDEWIGRIAINANMIYYVDAVVHVPLSLYQEVEYLLTSGSQYISMSDDLESGYVSEIRYKAATFKTNNPVLNHGTTNAQARVGNLATSASGYTAWFNKSDQLLISSSDSGIVNGTVRNTGSGIEVSLQTPNNTASGSWIYSPDLSGGTFICRNGYSTYQYGRYYVYYYGMKNSGTSVRQMYPCRRLSDNEAGMYDKISGTFFTNAGSGDFTVGADC